MTVIHKLLFFLILGTKVGFSLSYYSSCLAIQSLQGQCNCFVCCSYDLYTLSSWRSGLTASRGKTIQFTAYIFHLLSYQMNSECSCLAYKHEGYIHFLSQQETPKKENKLKYKDSSYLCRSVPWASNQWWAGSNMSAGLMHASRCCFP